MSSIGISSTRPQSPTDALLTQTSIRPKRSTAARARSRTDCSWATSRATARTSAPRPRHSSAVRSRSCWRRAAKTSEEPFFANAWAVARPMPLLAPVTTTTDFCRFPAPAPPSRPPQRCLPSLTVPARHVRSVDSELRLSVRARPHNSGPGADPGLTRATGGVHKPQQPS